MRLRLLFFALVLAGCGSLVQGRDYTIDQATRTITARNAAIAENICLMRGSAVAPDRQILGCYDARDDVVIVGADSPASALAHERAHRAGMAHSDADYGAWGTQ